ncbi:hypothetical protein M948_05260 [Virgibacillus sp. CM-4]|uniref:ABC transporter substrate-binding protein n=1 Tax=Virgibacillus sp. CM-4 TaxID=1354277 RepID=UPI0003882D1D|nr:extracellular solute-binding protein [Virgibacillus sp. CM-4]EQB37978.1 hypothetical protein M948_05260 [Virgibacillus sp. CM-4]
MVKKRSFGFLVMIMSIFLLLLAACGDDGGNESSGGNDAEAKEDVELRVVTTMAGTDPAGEVFETLLEEFKKENPHVSIVNESQSADAGTIRTKINTDFTSNNEPDLMFYFNTVDAEGIIDAGKVVNLEEAEGVDLSGYGEMLEQQRYEDGNLYAAPQTGFYEGLFVNKKLFEEHGVDLPTTWEKYEEAIKQFSETDIIPVAASTEDSYYVVEHYALAAGGAENYNATLADKNAAWAEGLDNIGKHAEMGAFPEDAGTIDLAMASNLFHQEQAAMLYEGSWAWGSIPEEVAEHVEVLPMPIYAEGGSTGDVVGGASQGWFISTKAYEDENKKDAVVKLFNFLTSEENILRIAEATGQVPAKGSLSDLPENIAVGHKMVDEAGSVLTPINDRILPEAFTLIRTSVPQIVSGDKTGKDVLEEATALE